MPSVNFDRQVLSEYEVESHNTATRGWHGRWDETAQFVIEVRMAWAKWLRNPFAGLVVGTALCVEDADGPMPCGVPLTYLRRLFSASCFSLFPTPRSNLSDAFSF